MIDYIDLPLKDAKVLKLKRLGDSRGWFTETFRESWLLEAGITNKFIFDYTSFNANTNTLRGMHTQNNITPQAKLVSVLNGSIVDVIVDARIDSPTYGQYCKIVIAKDDPCIVYVPRGFYHGLITTEPNTYVNYKLDNYFSGADEVGLTWNDTKINIDWVMSSEHDITLSQRDQSHPEWDNCYKFQGIL